MNWKKQGVVFKPEGDLDWAKTHAHVVCVQNMEDEYLRVIYSARDNLGRCMPGYVDLDIENPTKIIKIHDKPILDLGPAGAFDDCGIMPTWQVKNEKGYYLYYIGWNVRNTIPYHNSLGLAFSEDGQNYKKLFSGPVIERIPTEPYFNGSACVILDAGLYKMWYLSCTHWENINGRMEPFYHLKYATSEDGIHWNRTGQVSIDYATGDEGGISRPSVIKENGIYKMWYSYRGKTNYRQDEDRSQAYTIGYAESKDGIQFERKDDSAFALGRSKAKSWDDFMVEYPFVLDLRGKRYMFYNGNSFGQTGFGLAVWENDM